MLPLSVRYTYRNTAPAIAATTSMTGTAHLTMPLGLLCIMSYSSGACPQLLSFSSFSILDTVYLVMHKIEIFTMLLYQLPVGALLRNPAIGHDYYVVGIFYSA